MSRRDAEALDALARARSALEEGDAAAIPWFRLAAERPRWDAFDTDDEDAAGDSWRDAARGLALCSHRAGDHSTCVAWMLRIAEDAAAHGAEDRLTIAGERHRPWSVDYQCASRCESIRYAAITHLLDEHELSRTTGIDLLGLLSENHRFRSPVDAGHREADVERIIGILGVDDLDVGVGALATGGFADGGATRPVNAADAWAFAEWVLSVAVPEVFRVLGVPGGDELPKLTPLDLRTAGVERFTVPDWESMDFAEGSPGELPETEFVISSSPYTALNAYLTASVWEGDVGFYESAGRTPGPSLTTAHEVLDEAGLLTWHSPFADARRSDIDLPRLFVGTPLWSALWLAARTEDDGTNDWLLFSDAAGDILLGSLTAGLGRLTDGRAREAARARLVAALTQSLRAFVDARPRS